MPGFLSPQASRPNRLGHDSRRDRRSRTQPPMIGSRRDGDHAHGTHFYYQAKAVINSFLNGINHRGKKRDGSGVQDASEGRGRDT